MKAILLGLLKPIGFLAIFAVGSAAIIGTQAPASHDSSGATRCFTLLANAFAKEDATGLWDCFAPNMQQAYFSNGWSNDAELTTGLFGPQIKAKQTFKVTLYKQNPVKACKSDALGNQVCQTLYLFRVQVFEPDGTPASSCGVFGCSEEIATFAVHLKDGLIDDVGTA